MKILLKLRPYFKGHGWALMVGFLLMGLQNYGYTAMPKSIQALLDEILSTNRSEIIWRETTRVLVLMMLAGLGMYGMRKIIIGVSREMEYALRKDLFAKLGRLDFGFYQSRQTGDLISRCTNDLDHVRVLLGPGIMYIPNSLSRLVMFFPVLLGLDATLTAFVMIQMLLLIVLIVVLMPRMKPLHSQLQAQVGVLNSRVWQMLTGMNTIKLYLKEEVEKARFESLNQEYIRRFLHVEKYQSCLWPFFMTVFALSEVIILGWGGHQVIAGKMTLGEMLQFKVMVSVLSFPVLSLGWVMSIAQQGVSALERMAMIMDEPLREPPLGKWLRWDDSSPKSLHLRCENLSFAYPKASPRPEAKGQPSKANTNSLKPNLDSISFTLQPGQVMGITGPIGCGKSTLLHLLTGVLHPQRGQIWVNNIDLVDLDPEQHGQCMAFVPQDAFLFSRPMMDNIGLSGMDVSGQRPEGFLDKVTECANDAALDEDIAQFPKAYEEWVGERGVTLSGGQRQRTALARALFKKAPLLILDDALSAVDADTEFRILEGLKQRASGQSMIIVSHRISAIRHADYILVLHEGRLHEQGDHDFLMKKNGLYRHLADLQQMDRELNEELQQNLNNELRQQGHPDLKQGLSVESKV